jgi:hypothetical protein
VTPYDLVSAALTRLPGTSWNGVPDEYEVLRVVVRGVREGVRVEDTVELSYPRDACLADGYRRRYGLSAIDRDADARARGDYCAWAAWRPKWRFRQRRSSENFAGAA